MKVALSLLTLAIIVSLQAPEALGQSALQETYNPIPQTKSKWSGEFNLKANRNSDVYSDYFVSGEATVMYDLGPSQILYVEGGYLQPTTQDAERLQYYGMTDTSLGFYSKRLLGGETPDDISVDGNLEIDLPTSKVSQRASLITAVSALGIVRYPILPHLFAVSRHGGTLNFYNYETSNAAGTKFNYPWMLSNSVGLGVAYWKLAGTLDYGLAHMKDYANTTVNVQYVQASISASIDKNVMVLAYVRWRDRTLTNYEMFDMDTRTIGTSLRMYY